MEISDGWNPTAHIELVITCAICEQRCIEDSCPETCKEHGQHRHYHCASLHLSVPFVVRLTAGIEA